MSGHKSWDKVYKRNQSEHKWESPVPRDIPAALHDLGMPFHRSGEDEIETLCPYHSDTNLGNFSVNAETGSNHCFSCGDGGSFLFLVKFVKGCTWEDARQWIKNRPLRVTPVTDSDQLLSRSGHGRKNDTRLEMNESRLALFTDPPQNLLDDRGISLDSARRYGILWNQQNSSWIFPIRDPISDRLWGWQEKSLDGIVRNRPRGVRKGATLFGLNATRRHTNAIVVESPLDCAHMDTLGQSHGVSTFGAVITDAQLTVLQHQFEGLWLAMDNDEAGMKATASALARLDHTRMGRKTFVCAYGALTKGPKDPGDMNHAELMAFLDNADHSLRVSFDPSLYPRGETR